jgi:hypothetical protein
MSNFVNVVIARLTGVGGELASIEVEVGTDTADVTSDKIKKAIIDESWELAPGDTITIEEGEAERD